MRKWSLIRAALLLALAGCAPAPEAVRAPVVALSPARYSPSYQNGFGVGEGVLVCHLERSGGFVRLRGDIEAECPLSPELAGALRDVVSGELGRVRNEFRVARQSRDGIDSFGLWVRLEEGGEQLLFESFYVEEVWKYASGHFSGNVESLLAFRLYELLPEESGVGRDTVKAYVETLRIDGLYGSPKKVEL